MTLVTLCPTCQTTFKVVPDQMRIAEGWVRCGRCSQVFDASIELREIPEVESATPDPERRASVELAPDIVTLSTQFVGAPQPGDRDAVEEPRDSVETVSANGSMIERPAYSPLEKSVRRARERAAKIERARDKAAARRKVLLHEVEVAAAGVVGGGKGVPEPAIIPLTPSFARVDATRTLLSDRPGVLRALVASAGLAVVLLGLQILHHQRDAIVAWRPALQPSAVAWCKLVGCEVAALRKISAITIDGATFSREPGGSYRLAFALRNTATTPLAMPAVELSLLDTQERTVVRRVLFPPEFGAPPVLAAGSECPFTLPLTLSVPESTALPPVAGYRVVAFYP